jgi:hypothetical protein
VSINRRGFIASLPALCGIALLPPVSAPLVDWPVSHILLSEELIRDSGIPISTYLQRMFAEHLTAALDASCSEAMP